MPVNRTNQLPPQFGSLLGARSSNFTHMVSKEGLALREKPVSLDTWKGKLVAWVEAHPHGSAPGRWLSHTIKAFFGSNQTYRNLCSDLEYSKKTSVNNALGAFFESMDKGGREMDADLRDGFEKIKHTATQELTEKVGKMTVSDLSDFASELQRQVDARLALRQQERFALRQQEGLEQQQLARFERVKKLIEKLDRGEPTSAMSALTRDERKVAVACTGVPGKQGKPKDAVEKLRQDNVEVESDNIDFEKIDIVLQEERDVQMSLYEHFKSQLNMTEHDEMPDVSLGVPHGVEELRPVNAIPRDGVAIEAYNETLAMQHEGLYLYHKVLKNIDNPPEERKTPSDPVKNELWQKLDVMEKKLAFAETDTYEVKYAVNRLNMQITSLKGLIEDLERSDLAGGSEVLKGLETNQRFVNIVAGMRDTDDFSFDYWRKGLVDYAIDPNNPQDLKIFEEVGQRIETVQAGLRQELQQRIEAVGETMEQELKSSTID